MLHIYGSINYKLYLGAIGLRGEKGDEGKSLARHDIEPIINETFEYMNHLGMFNSSRGDDGASGQDGRKGEKG